MNKKLQIIFDHGIIKEAIIGEGEYFIPDHTYRDYHDNYLVLSELNKWADTNEKKVKCRGEVIRAIDFLTEKSDIKESFRLILTCLIVRRNFDNDLFDVNKLEECTNELINNNLSVVINNKNIISILLEIEKYIPTLRINTE